MKQSSLAKMVWGSMEQPAMVLPYIPSQIIISLCYIKVYTEINEKKHIDISLDIIYNNEEGYILQN